MTPFRAEDWRKKMDRNGLMAIVVSLIIWVGWQKMYWEPYQEKQKQWNAYQNKLKKSQDEKSDNTGARISNTAIKSAENVSPAIQRIEKQTKALDLFSLVLSNTGGLLDSWKLKDFKINKGKEKVLGQGSAPIDMEYITGFSNQLQIAFSDTSLIPKSNSQRWTVDDTSKNVLYQDRLQNNRVKIVRTLYRPEKSYTMPLKYTISFQREVPAFVFLDIFGSPKREHDTSGNMLGGIPDRVAIAYQDRSEKEIFPAEGLEKPQELVNTGVYWLGVDTRYFLLALIPDNLIKPFTGIQIRRVEEQGKIAVLGRLAISTNGQKELTIPLDVYFGPKRIEILEQASPALVGTLDFGWVSIIALPILKMLKWFYFYVHNYGVAIILVTIFVKLLLFPLTYKSMKSLTKISKLRPQMQVIQEKHKGDKQRLQKELMDLYRNNGANPISGCLPILLQMPVFFALYRVLFNCMELYGAPFFGWIQDLSAKDPLFITPILLVLLMVMQQKIMPNTVTDPTQKRIMQLMPIIFGVFMLFLPAGLNIYMLINTVISIAQQYFLNKRFNVSPIETTKAVPSSA